MFSFKERLANKSFYLPGCYLNFIVANGVVVTARFWREGMPASQREKDRRAREILERAFPGREVVQVDTLPLVDDGGGSPLSLPESTLRRGGPPREIGLSIAA